MDIVRKNVIMKWSEVRGRIESCSRIKEIINLYRKISIN